MQIAVSAFLVIVSVLLWEDSFQAQQKPTDAGSSSQQELERLQTIMAQFTAHVCQDINPTVTILTTDPSDSAAARRNNHIEASFAALSTEGSVPNLADGVHHEAKLGPLLVLCEEIPFHRGRETTLRAEC